MMQDVETAEREERGGTAAGKNCLCFMFLMKMCRLRKVDIRYLLRFIIFLIVPPPLTDRRRFRAV